MALPFTFCFMFQHSFPPDSLALNMTLTCAHTTTRTQKHMNTKTQKRTHTQTDRSKVALCCCFRTARARSSSARCTRRAFASCSCCRCWKRRSMLSWSRSTCRLVDCRRVAAKCVSGSFPAARMRSPHVKSCSNESNNKKLHCRAHVTKGKAMAIHHRCW